VRNLKKLSILFVFSFILLCSPYFLLSNGENKGNMVGFIYRADGTTPLENGIVTIRNISTGSVYGSVESNNLGAFKIEGIEKGLYLVTISTKERGYKVENLIGVQADRASKVSFSIFVNRDNANQGKPVGNANIIASSEPIVFNWLGNKGNDDDHGENEDCPSPHKPRHPWPWPWHPHK
jgi:hypothetical protein